LIDVANDISTRRGIDQHGTAWHSQIRNDGSQVWLQVRGNKITNGGINNPPKVWDPQTGYSAPNKPTKGPKNK
jgi:filamentous hemagglutinin